MKIPKTVNICGVTYKVRVVKEWKGGENLMGEHICRKDMGNVIYIDSDITPEAQAKTFFHEAFHAMNSTMNHEFLESFSHQVYQLLADNKLLK